MIPPIRPKHAARGNTQTRHINLSTEQSVGTEKNCVHSAASIPEYGKWAGTSESPLAQSQNVAEVFALIYRQKSASSLFTCRAYVRYHATVRLQHNTSFSIFYLH